MFLLHQFRSRLSKQVISISFKKRFCNIRWVGISENRFVSSQKLQQVALFLKIRLVPIFSDVRALPQVSLCRRSSDLEMNLTSNLLFQRSKFVIVPHSLLAPVSTVVKPAEHEFVRRPSLLLEA